MQPRRQQAEDQRAHGEVVRHEARNCYGKIRQVCMKSNRNARIGGMRCFLLPQVILYSKVDQFYRFFSCKFLEISFRWRVTLMASLSTHPMLCGMTVTRMSSVRRKVL